MTKNKNNNPHTKTAQKRGFHPKNIHTGRYDLTLLQQSTPELSAFITLNPAGQETIDFTNPKAVKTLNKALLISHYNLEYWDIPDGFLCPPIPSRADYIHHIADLLQLPYQGTKNNKHLHDKQAIRVLDIGTGANCIYPIIGAQCYGWHFTATDIDVTAIKNAQLICDNNPLLCDKIIVKQQQDSNRIFKGIINQQDNFMLTMCNPPFHASLDEAMASNQRKQKNLAYNKAKKNDGSDNNITPSSTQIHSRKQNINTGLNFGGQKSELWCEGGELSFLQRMVVESSEYKQQVRWFTTLVSKNENLAPLMQTLANVKATTVKEIPMYHGQKTTRILAWSWQ